MRVFLYTNTYRTVAVFYVIMDIIRSRYAVKLFRFDVGMYSCDQSELRTDRIVTLVGTYTLYLCPDVMLGCIRV
jgi:hypothetical protein